MKCKSGSVNGSTERIGGSIFSEWNSRLKMDINSDEIKKKDRLKLYSL